MYLRQTHQFPSFKQAASHPHWPLKRALHLPSSTEGQRSVTSLIWPCLRLWKQTLTYFLLSDAHTCVHSVHLGTAVRNPPEPSHSPTGGSSFICLEAVCSVNPLFNDSTQSCMNRESTTGQGPHKPPPAVLSPHLVLTSLTHLPDSQKDNM